eukprot:2007037-Lingulodinium_polyedra.AAC.1
MLEAAQQHLQHHSWKNCALSDALLASPLIYPELATDCDNYATTSDSASEARFAPPGAVTAAVEHNSQLSTKQANILLQKIIKSYEEETSSVPAEGKSKSRMQLPEDVIAARRTVQWWEPAGRE